MQEDAKIAHPLSEAVAAENDRCSAAIAVDTFDGKVHVEWDPTAAVTPHRPIALFYSVSQGEWAVHALGRAVPIALPEQ